MTLVRIKLKAARTMKLIQGKKDFFFANHEKKVKKYEKNQKTCFIFFKSLHIRVPKYYSLNELRFSWRSD